MKMIHPVIRSFGHSVIATRRGSALLIVLGLVSFMLVSAVAFSVYMRTTRLPSSYLLRTSSSRQLVKAGLMEALDVIERAVADNPHPGVGATVTQKGNLVENETLRNRNFWRDRVFIGTNEPCSTRQTVSTLTLEGLAYVPPPLINEVRYWSRRTPSAAWHTFGFNSGRYAFTAVDVSDYFDINRTMAAPENEYGQGGRTSAADGRVSLAYLFEDSGHSGWTVKPDKWDAFMDNFLDESAGSKVPLISLADYNLAVKDNLPAPDVLSPWCRFIENGTEFVQDNAAERHALSNLVFVTDSWYPEPAADKDIPDLATAADQPFRSLPLSNSSGYSNRGFDTVVQNANTKTFRYKGANYSWTDILAPPELAQLYDYLDADSIPISLALPTAERAPMVTGLYLHPAQAIVQVVPAGETYETPVAQDANGKYKYEVKTYTVKVVLDELNLMTGLVYPFKHKRPTAKSYKVQGFASVALVRETEQGNLRPAKTSWATKPEWSAGGDKDPILGIFGNAANRPSGFWIRSKPQTVVPPTTVTKERDALIPDQELDFGSAQVELISELPETANGVTGLRKDKCSVRVVQKMRQVMVAGVPTPTWNPEGDPIRELGMLPATADLGAAEADPAGDFSLVPTIQVWVRVTEVGAPANRAAVDLVPACADDDAVMSEMLTDASGSAKRPVLRFRDGSYASRKVVVKQGEVTGGGDIDVKPQAYVTGDPRFNYAPENFVAVDTLGGQVGETWFTEAKSKAAGRDGDIFMATSDAGYLQSRYELANLLRIVNFNASDDFGCLTGNRYDGQPAANYGDFAADNSMWRTYTFYPVDGFSNRTEFDRYPMASGRGGARICPYTPDTAVMMGALANTPFDWWAASTNGTDSAKQGMLSNPDTALRYTFSDHASDTGSRVSWAEMEDLAQDFISRFRGSTSVDGWKNLYDDMGWDVDDPNDEESFGDLCGASFDLVKFHSTDRKFLYGFWRDCFEVRQQLYLVFVRAEPMMMGGGIGGHMPPMLGARAVALVWRDPTPTAGTAPHRMRILFYRQFD